MQTAVTNVDEKIDLIEHINQDHSDEMMAVVQAYTRIQTMQSAYLSDIFAEGVDIAVIHSNGRTEKVFLPFDVQGDMEEKILYLAYSAMAKLGKPLSDSRRQFFTVEKSAMLTPNIIRLTIQSPVALPENQPAYAYGFLLKTLRTMPNKIKPAVKQKGIIKKYCDIALLWFIKKQSGKQRNKILYSMNKGIRYYTLQTAWRSEDSGFYNMGFVDIFLHGNSAGNEWAKKLQAGDVITTRVEGEDKHQNIHQGQALLVADETGYPALLGLLQQWKNPLAPYVVIVSSDEKDQDYFKSGDMQMAKTMQQIVCPANIQGERIIEIISAFDDITTAWGAIEKQSAKVLRAYLRNHNKIQGNNNRIRGYWTL